jgi:hypothetical protein
VKSLLSQIERVPTSSLELYPGNPRRGNVNVIARSLRENALYSPLVVQASTRHVLSGNHTPMAARQIGWDEIDVVFVDVDDNRARKILLSANRTSDLALDDNDDLLALLDALDGDYDGTGWTEDDVAHLLTPSGQKEGGDAGQDELPHGWGIVVDCDSEMQQAELLAELDARAFKVRALIT